MKIIVKYCGLAALLAGAAFCLPSCDDDPTGPEPEPYEGVWEWVPTPKCLATVNDIYFVSANDGWAVAGHQIWHYDGSSWKLFKELRPADPRYDYGLTQVWFNGPNDGWVAGIENRTYTTAGISRRCRPLTCASSTKCTSTRPTTGGRSAATTR
jgi:hypothetical protein